MLPPHGVSQGKGCDWGQDTGRYRKHQDGHGSSARVDNVLVVHLDGLPNIIAQYRGLVKTGVATPKIDIMDTLW